MSTSKETAVHAEFDAMARKAEQFLARETVLLDNRRFWMCNPGFGTGRGTAVTTQTSRLN